MRSSPGEGSAEGSAGSVPEAPLPPAPATKFGGLGIDVRDAPGASLPPCVPGVHGDRAAGVAEDDADLSEVVLHVAGIGRALALHAPSG